MGIQKACPADAWGLQAEALGAWHCSARQSHAEQAGQPEFAAALRVSRTRQPEYEARMVRRDLTHGGTQAASRHRRHRVPDNPYDK